MLQNQSSSCFKYFFDFLISLTISGCSSKKFPKIKFINLVTSTANSGFKTLNKSSYLSSILISLFFAPFTWTDLTFLNTASISIDTMEAFSSWAISFLMLEEDRKLLIRIFMYSSCAILGLCIHYKLIRKWALLPRKLWEVYQTP